MKRPSKFDGEGKSLAGDISPSPLGPPLGPTVIQFPSPAAKSAGAREGAGVSSASASSTFVPLGSAIRPVILRLKGHFPRISIPARPGEEEEEQAAPADQSAGERD